MIKKIFPLILLQMLSTNSFADNKVEVITTCEVQKIAYVHIEPYNSQYRDVFKSVPTSFSFKEEQNGETYSLVVETKDNEEFINLYYKPQNKFNWEWNMLDIVKTDAVKVIFLNKDPHNLILKTISPKFNQEQVYYFNLDHKGNGFMSMVNTRWNSFADLINNQSLFFCICKNSQIK